VLTLPISISGFVLIHAVADYFIQSIWNELIIPDMMSPAGDILCTCMTIGLLLHFMLWTGCFYHHLFSALMLLVGRQEGRPACEKNEWWGAGVVICLERGADLHTAQLMPLPLTVSCFIEIQIGFTFVVPACPAKHTQQFNGRWSGTTWVGPYQKKHSPIHIHPDHRTSFINLSGKKGC